MDFAQQFAALAAEVAGMDAAAARRIEAALREQHGGRSVRILPEPVRAAPTRADVDAGLRQGKPVRVIAQEFGVHRATLYRLLKRRPGKSQPKA